MESQRSGHGDGAMINGGKGFIFTLAATAAFIMILAAMVFFIINQAQKSPLLINVKQNMGLQDSVFKLLNDKLMLNHSRTSNTYMITEAYAPTKQSSLATKVASIAAIANTTAFRSGLNFSFNNQGFSLLNLRSKGFSYYWLSNTDLLIEANSSHENFTALNLSFSTTANSNNITNNCSGSGNVTITVASNNQQASATPTGSCTITINYPSNSIAVNYISDNSWNVSFAGMPDNAVITANISVSPGTNFADFSSIIYRATLTTSNPGVTEPTYPGTTAAIKYFGNVTVEAQVYQVIVIDYDNDSVYESAYFDVDQDNAFNSSADLKLVRRGVAIYLNNRVLLVDSGTAEITLLSKLGVFAKRGEVTVIR
ncbi:MAG: hypothetical protein J4432_05340 [DPANN group archaeon]|nr:hypothetical protein [DPANN group archaeon]